MKIKFSSPSGQCERKYRLVGDNIDGSPGLYDSRKFEIALKLDSSSN